MRHLDLFSGIGGFALACKWLGITTAQFVEINPYCQSVLRKNFPGVPIHEDVATFTARPNTFNLITCGFPCQDISQANPHGIGLEGERSGLFHTATRIIRSVRPQLCIFENVPALISRGMDSVLWQIADLGFDAEWGIVSAQSTGANHLRRRLFIIAYPQGKRSPGSYGLQAWSNPTSVSGNTWWGQNPPPEPTLCRVDDGLPRGLATRQMRALGNAVVPQVAKVVLERALWIYENLEINQ